MASRHLVSRRPYLGGRRLHHRLLDAHEIVAPRGERQGAVDKAVRKCSFPRLPYMGPRVLAIRRRRIAAVHRSGSQGCHAAVTEFAVPAARNGCAARAWTEATVSRR